VEVDFAARPTSDHEGSASPNVTVLHCRYECLAPRSMP